MHRFAAIAATLYACRMTSQCVKQYAVHKYNYDDCDDSALLILIDDKHALILDFETGDITMAQGFMQQRFPMTNKEKLAKSQRIEATLKQKSYRFKKNQSKKRELTSDVRGLHNGSKPDALDNEVDPANWTLFTGTSKEMLRQRNSLQANKEKQSNAHTIRSTDNSILKRAELQGVRHTMSSTDPEYHDTTGLQYSRTRFHGFDNTSERQGRFFHDQTNLIHPTTQLPAPPSSNHDPMNTQNVPTVLNVLPGLPSSLEVSPSKRMHRRTTKAGSARTINNMRLGDQSVCDVDISIAKSEFPRTFTSKGNSVSAVGEMGLRSSEKFKRRGIPYSLYKLSNWVSENIAKVDDYLCISFELNFEHEIFTILKQKMTDDGKYFRQGKNVQKAEVREAFLISGVLKVNHPNRGVRMQFTLSFKTSWLLLPKQAYHDMIKILNGSALKDGGVQIDCINIFTSFVIELNTKEFEVPFKYFMRITESKVKDSAQGTCILRLREAPTNVAVLGIPFSELYNPTICYAKRRRAIVTFHQHVTN